MILYVFIVGILAAVCSIAFVTVFEAFEKLKTHSKINLLAYPILGGATVGIIGLFFPQVLGVGYDTIGASINGTFYDASITLFVALIALKIVATSLTLNSGGSGGLFIPSIYVGAVLGALFSKILLGAPSEVIVVASMAAMLAATNKTLLTGVAFVAETAGPSSIILTLISATTSYFVSGNLSFYRDTQLVERPEGKEGALHNLFHSITKKGKLEEIKKDKVAQLMMRDPVSLEDTMTIREALERARNFSFRVYPIVSLEGALEGFTTVEDLLLIPEEKRGLALSNSFMRKPLSVTEESDLLSLVTQMIDQEVDHAYVVKDIQSMKLTGVVSEIDIVRTLLKHV